MARRLGARSAIGVDVTFSPDQADLDDPFDALFQGFSILTHRLALVDRVEADVMIEPPIPVHNEMSAATLTLMYVGEQAALAAMPPSRGFSLKPGRCQHEPEENPHDVVECLITQKAERRATLRLTHPWPRKPISRTSMSKFREARVHAKCRMRHRRSWARAKDVSDR
ncbi:hypothetical protein D8I24_2656 (plasmid) [Cupriavidus necator H850]|uniref:hypothetical protein n=1 Tax=Cupriavidus necator TaxID=106590 RepID=UPI00129E66A4|nr:hypothetical protein [Cupriavidus necator]KAI3604951.1 hypothetical protein D8I24_2656 [Cupriavidus necator H850]